MATLDRLDLPLPDGVCDTVRGLPDVGAAPPDGAPVARADGTTAYPPVLFLMDAIGLRPRLEEMIATVADMGYAVLAPNVYYREGRQPLVPAETLGDDEARHAVMMPLIRRYSPAMWAVDGPAYLDHLAAWPAATREPVRIVGYCMGGRLGITLAAAEPDRVACVAGYHNGGLVTDAPDSPHRQLGSVRCPLYLGYADHDRGATPEQQEAFRSAAREAGVDLTDELYAGAAHGYTMADIPAYDPDATARHWETLRETFARVG